MPRSNQHGGAAGAHFTRPSSSSSSSNASAAAATARLRGDLTSLASYTATLEQTHAALERRAATATAAAAAWPQKCTALEKECERLRWLLHHEMRGAAAAEHEVSACAELVSKFIIRSFTLSQLQQPQTTNNKQQTTNNKQQTTNNKQKTKNNKQKTKNKKQQTTNNKQKTTNKKQQTTNKKQQTTNNK
jgi:hypothetical protein